LPRTTSHLFQPWLDESLELFLATNASRPTVGG
jgi:hypothetical protein